MSDGCTIPLTIFKSFQRLQKTTKIMWERPWEKPKNYWALTW